jgi:hypothetical protein
VRSLAVSRCLTSFAGRDMGAYIETVLSSLCRMDGVTGGPAAIVLHLFLDIVSVPR